MKNLVCRFHFLFFYMVLRAALFSWYNIFSSASKHCHNHHAANSPTNPTQALQTEAPKAELCSFPFHPLKPRKPNDFWRSNKPINKAHCHRGHRIIDEKPNFVRNEQTHQHSLQQPYKTQQTQKLTSYQPPNSPPSSR